jgi:anti-sigma factor RsiW
VSGGGSSGRFRRVGRRPDHWSSPHERATVRAAERLDGPLPPAEATWLDEHLATCAACRAIAERYIADRLALRQLRDETVEPPRDLWARTAAGIERESGARDRAARPPRRRRATSAPALGALSGLAVVMVVVVATAISGGLFRQLPPAAPSSPVAIASHEIEPQPTPIAIGPAKVHWLGAAEDGMFAYNVASIDAVCPVDRRPDCAPFEDDNAKRVTLSATPKYVFQSPVENEAVIVGTDASGADAVLVVVLPTPDPTPPAPDVSPAPTDATVSPVATASALATPTPTPVVVASSELSILPSDAIGSDELASLLPDASGVSGSPSPEPIASGSQPPAGSAIAIITDVTVVGRAAAYSPDGAWFAFSARPADGSAGPDIYVWHVGELQARAVTSDHASLFASWVGGNILGSRIESEPETATAEPGAGASPSVVASPGAGASPTAGPSPTAGASPGAGADPSLEVSRVKPTIEIPPPSGDPPSIDIPQDSTVARAPGAAEALLPLALERVPETFLLDPWTGVELAQLESEWQPAVDPTGLAVVAWQGTVSLGADGLTAMPAVGSLVIHPFHGPFVSEDPIASVSPGPDVTSTPTPTATPTPTPTPTPAPTPAAPPDGSGSSEPSVTPVVAVDFPTQALVSGPIVDFDARWDETGSWLAIWIADPIDPALGRLSLLRFDRATGVIDRPLGAPQDMTALPGFSIGDGRLAWASPPGQEGEGSRIHIAAWTADLVGAIESIPVEGAIVVQ